MVPELPGDHPKTSAAEGELPEDVDNKEETALDREVATT